MSPIEYIRHNFLGAKYVLALCDDPSCHTRLGSKILHNEHNGYGDDAPSVSKEQRNKAEQAIKAHNPSHITRLIIGHHSEMDEEKGVSKTIYEYKAPWSDRG